METTSTTLGWAIYYMLKHPEIQTKVQEELDRVVGQSRGVSLKDKENLPYTGKYCKKIISYELIPNLSEELWCALKLNLRLNLLFALQRRV